MKLPRLSDHQSRLTAVVCSFYWLASWLPNLAQKAHHEPAVASNYYQNGPSHYTLLRIPRVWYWHKEISLEHRLKASELVHGRIEGLFYALSKDKNAG
jgi:hypothetical protein